MASALLETKIRIPPITHRLLQRARLIDALERDIPRHRLSLMSTPAGYGKTTLLTQWARASHYPIAWLSLGNEDDDSEHFLQYLVAAWELAQPGITAGPLELLAGSLAPDRDALLTAFVNTGNLVPDHTVFVLDDYHLIHDPSIHEAMTFLLDHLPPPIHFVIASRGKPPLPLARYRARQELLELNTRDLHFSMEETESFLNELKGLKLATDELMPVHTQMEGWAAGLQLVALTLRGDHDSGQRLTMTGQHRHIADYLSQDVLGRLADGPRQFLLQTSILDQLSAELCDAVTGRHDGQEMLELLEREDLFLMPLDDHREWYRYHGIFADFLQGELRRHHGDVVAELHRRAARWYRSHDVSEQAFHQALASQDVDLVLDTLERYTYPKILGGEIRGIQRWLDAIPADWFAAHPELGIYRAVLTLATGAFDACLLLLDGLEQRFIQAAREDSPAQRARVAALRCFLACFQNDIPAAETFASQALGQLPEEDLNFRPGVYGALGDTYRRNARWDEARRWYLKLLDFAHAPIARTESVHLFGALADLSLRQGRLNDAARYWRQALTAIEDPNNDARYPLPLTGWVYVRMAEILYEWNALADARDLLSRGRLRGEAGGDVRTLIAADLAAGRLDLAQGNDDAAAAHLEQARSLLETAQFPEWSSAYDRLQVELWLARRQISTAANWASTNLERDAFRSEPEADTVQLGVARVLIATADRESLDRAIPLLDSLAATASAEGRVGVRIEALALSSLAHWQRREATSALRSLEQALRLARPEGYVRIFADLGLPMIRVLQEAHSRDVMPDYIEALLQASGTNVASPARGQTAIPKPLTDREQEILGLIAAGLTNREIADTLVISPETVKKHAGNIFGKLGARNRTEAVARARDLHQLHE